MATRDLKVTSTGIKQVSVGTTSSGGVAFPRRQTSAATVLRAPVGTLSVHEQAKNVFVQAAVGPQGAQGLQGPIGPVGPSGTGSGSKEEEEVYATRVDFINDNMLYRAEAAVGAADSAPVWRIRRVVISNDGDISEMWANGSANFVNIWNDRTTLNYS